MSVSELAAALGVRPSTLRHWDAEGLVVPDRVPSRGTRRYSPAQARDARIVHQLRSAGYRMTHSGP
ncbi:MerR family transcriptional regulator [Streptomyces sp. NPDC057486]|uniref:MerR family transcriptional regulator n=1 Tax=Streptomyces sp. NPDC057486 TaxID=3346145 RepID=UPI0036C23967